MRPKAITKGYYLPVELTDWLKQRAKKEKRSASNMLAVIVEKAKNDEQ